MYTQNLEKIAIGKLTLQLVALYALTTWHHVYGSYIYDSAWRINGVLWALVFVIPMILFLNLTTSVLFKKAGYYMAMLWIVVIGFFEGGYNHVFKNILFSAGSSDEWFFTFFSKKLGYAKPDDILFELTGVLTFSVGVICFVNLLNWKKNYGIYT